MPSGSCATDLICTRCDKVHDLHAVHNLCACGAPLSVRYDLQEAGRRMPRPALSQRRHDLWRYEEVLPVQDNRFQVCLGEGGTPLLELPRLRARLGCGRLLLKDESLNPTNSFKARGMAVAVARAWELGLGELATPSAGNAGCALAAYAARAGLRCQVFMPDDTPRASVEECIALGATVELVDGLIDECGRLVAEGRQKFGWFDVSTLKEPYRLEGKKTLGYELAEQLGWQLPDVIVYPTGGGTGLVGMWKAFEEMRQMQWIDARLPRMVSVQSSGCAPIVRAFERGTETATPWEDAETFALGLRVPRAVGDFLMLRVLRDSQGTALAVSDGEISVAGRDLALQEGTFASPEGAATWAAAQRLREQGIIDADSTVVLFNTGGWYKYAEGWRSSLGL